jgi:trehalose synthase
MPLTEVKIAPAPPERFRELLGDDFAGVERAMQLANEILPGRVIWHINSTPRGGGVAEMLQSLLAYARGAGVDVRWEAITGNPEFFRVTKRIHNRLHGSAGDGGELEEAEREVYESAVAPAVEELARLVSPKDVVYIHDPQPAPLLKGLQERGVACVWRCHVGLDHPNDIARETWDFLRPYVELADAYVFSRREFVWDGLDDKRIWLVPPSIDAFSAKNQEIPPDVQRAILTCMGLTEDGGSDPVFRRNDGTVARVNRKAEIDQDERVPWDAPVVAQVSRWDRLKDPIGLLDCFAEHVRHREARLLLAGPTTAGVADDPEGAEVLAEVRARRAELPEGIRRRTHLISLPMDDVEENAAMVNALQRRADVIVQKSLQEGFGLTVAEAMWKGKPVVAGRVGGIQDQIVNGDGVLVDDPTDLVAVGDAIDRLLDDPEWAGEVGRNAKQRVLDEYLGSRHLVQYMDLLRGMLTARDG